MISRPPSLDQPQPVTNKITFMELPNDWKFTAGVRVKEEDDSAQWYDAEEGEEVKAMCHEWYDAATVQTYEQNDETEPAAAEKDVACDAQPLYSGAPITVAESMLLIFALSLHHNLTGSYLVDILTNNFLLLSNA